MSFTTSSVTSAFIDLATFDELEKYLHGGPSAIAYFVRGHRKATWFSQVPVVLSRASGTPDFGTDWSVSISRAGDYLLQTWLRVVLTCTPSEFDAVDAVDDDPAVGARAFTRNLAHNLVEECTLTFNDLTAARFDSYHLDFWTAFTVPAGKRNGYNNMIGNVPGVVVPGQTKPAEIVLNLPLPFFFSRDSGVALPTAALPYNDMRINFRFRKLSDLIVEADGTNIVAPTTPTLPTVTLTADVWANYAIVSNDERKRMACAPRDILIEQVQTAPVQTMAGTGVKHYDIRFSHSVKALFFAARNTTVPSVWSNYTDSAVTTTTDGKSLELGGSDPIDNTSLVYENTARLSQMKSDFFSLVQPYYHAPFIPLETGYHMYSYALDVDGLDPTGSTNYGKLTNVSVVPQLTTEAGENTGQKFSLVVTAVNMNIIRVSGGALGFPVL